LFLPLGSLELNARLDFFEEFRASGLVGGGVVCGFVYGWRMSVADASLEGGLD
jgi:hypothetical protein